ncbi:MAG: hypothetical protein K2X47_20125 [Bdellovibrionales bacterium]|nr:hypothetical protein [Bdellovibrionales bacterium]
MMRSFFRAMLSLALFGCGQLDLTKHDFQTPAYEGKDLMIGIRDFADSLRLQISDPLLNDPALSAVTKEYGPTIIQNNLPLRSGVAVSAVKPWSSWWFPKRDPEIFSDSRGTLWSALEKYDIVRERRQKNANSALDYERNNHNPNSLAWEGLCDAWSIASISKPEPMRPVTIRAGKRNVTFTVSELKALLLKTYEAVEDAGLKYYGQKFTGTFSGWIHPDIFPEQFHRLIEIQLFRDKLPLIMDHDPGVEVWNVPIFKANYLMEAIPNQPDKVFVRAWVYTAEPTKSENRDDTGTRESVREYNYVLQGTRNAAGALVVNSGYWIKGPDGVDSRKDHPDYMINADLSGKLVRNSWNPELDIDLVDEILAASYSTSGGIK